MCNVHLTFLSKAAKNRKQNPNEYISKSGASYKRMLERNFSPSEQET
jgi:hypothetical protein